MEVDIYGWGRKPAKDIGDHHTIMTFKTMRMTFTHMVFTGDAICDYMLTIVIENNFEPLYCTEKLINALLCGTVPVYRLCDV